MADRDQTTETHRPLADIERDWHCASEDMSLHYAIELVRAQSAEIERIQGACQRLEATNRRLVEALWIIHRRCGEDGGLGADRGHRWAAEVASRALSGESYVE